MTKLTATLRNAELIDGRVCDVKICDGVITEIAENLSGALDEQIDACGRAVCVALKDHHLHLYAAAAIQNSIACGPPQVHTRADLAAVLAQAPTDANGWIRAVGFHEAHCGPISRQDLDAWRADVPLRLQHASGRLWILNSMAIAQLAPAPWSSAAAQQRGHLLEQDAWLSEQLGKRFPGRILSLADVSEELASYGVVAVTDTSPANGLQHREQFSAAQQSGELRQRLRLMGNEQLTEQYAENKIDGELNIGSLKIHLLESALPEFDVLCQQIQRAHSHRRPVAFHCVSRVELVFALAALQQMGSIEGDRIEHVGICPDDCLQQMNELQLCVVTQPVFIHDRGDRYLRDVPLDEQPYLYRLRAFREHAIALAASSDAPYGDLNPWRGIAAAMQRRSRDGACIGPQEALNFDQALALYQGELHSPGTPMHFAVGEMADLCLLNDSWKAIRQSPQDTRALLCLQRGKVIWHEPL
ncbi:MAG: amidohydrolase family protein [Oceanococcus sp.]